MFSKWWKSDCLFCNFAHLREEEELDPILNVGTCGLHVVHVSFKTGAKGSEWNLSKILQAMWRILDRSPCRSDSTKDYELAQIVCSSIIVVQYYILVRKDIAWRKE